MANLQFASAGDDIKLWDCGGYSLARQFNPHSHNISCITWAHDNTAIASASTAGDKIVITYNNAATYQFEENADKTCIAFNSASRYIVAGGKNGLVNVWDLKTKTLKKTYQNHKGKVTSVQFNWNDSDIATASETGEIILYNVQTSMASKPLITPTVQSIQQIAYSSFKKSLLGAVSDDGAFNLWDTNKRTLLHSFAESHKAPATGISFSTYNEMLVMTCGLDKRIHCYDVASKKSIKTITAESPLTAIEMTDSATVAVGSTRGKIYIYDLRQGVDPVRTMAAHKSSVQSLAFQHSDKRSRFESGGTGKKMTKSISHTQLDMSSRKPPSNIHQQTTAVKATMYSKPVQNKHLPVYSSNSTASTLQSYDVKSNLINNNTDDTGEVFSPLKDDIITVEENDGNLNVANSYEQNTSNKAAMSKYSNAVFSPLANEDLQSKNSPNGIISPLLRSYSTGVMANFKSETSLPPLAAQAKTDSTFEETTVRDIPSEPKNINKIVTPELPEAVPQGPIDEGTKLFSKKNSNRGESSAVNAQITSIQGSISLPEHMNTLQNTVSTLSIDSNQKKEVATDAITEETGAVGLCQPSGLDLRVLQSMIEDAVEDLRDQMRKDVLNLHMEMLKQFQSQKAEIHSLLQHYSPNEEMMEEIRILREENKRLKAKH